VFEPHLCSISTNETYIFYYSTIPRSSAQWFDKHAVNSQQISHCRQSGDPLPAADESPQGNQSAFRVVYYNGFRFIIAETTQGRKEGSKKEGSRPEATNCVCADQS